MGYDADRQAIETRFQTMWGSTTDIAYKGIPYKPTTGQAFVRVRTKPYFNYQMELAGNDSKYRNVGAIQIDINVPDNIGTKLISQYADQVVAIFKGQNFDGIQCRGVNTINDREWNGWLIWNIVFIFNKDE